MKHHIIVKFKDGTDVQALREPVKEIFDETLKIPGIHGVDIKTSCSDRDNRYDLMIVMDMDPEALPAYDVCEPHLRWKEQYGPLMEKKALFDCED